MTTGVRDQYTTTEVTRILLYCYWFKVIKEDIKTIWHAYLKPQAVKAI
jgi:hypothetical protein